VPTAALRHAQPDDLFWAARRVVAFSNEMIRALVRTAGYSDPAVERQLGDILIQRRDKIGAAYLIAINPLVNFELSLEGQLSFDNAAVDAGVARAPAGGYRLSWARFDNAAATATPIGESAVQSGDRIPPPGPLPHAPGSFLRIRVSAIDPPYETWNTPVTAYFRLRSQAWRLVGLERST
jgi:hypothetical protein